MGNKKKKLVKANTEGTHLGFFPIVILWICVKAAQPHPSSAQLVLRASKEAADISSWLKIFFKKLHLMVELSIFVNKDNWNIR